MDAQTVAYTLRATRTPNNAADDIATLTFSITVEADIAPAFAASATIDDQTYTQGVPITNLTLPVATGGNGPTTYTLTPALPAGLTHNAAVRTITGNPTATLTATMFTYTATDGDDNTAGSDTDTLTFSITVEADIAPAFATDASIPNQTFAVGEMVALTLPAVETPGNGATRYFLSIPHSLLSGGSIFGLTYDEATLTLTGTATAGTRSLVWVAEDSDTNYAANDTARLEFIITVGEDTAPAFADGASIADQLFTPGRSVYLTLPVATGGNGALRYTLTPALPAGLIFSRSTGALIGTPTTAAPTTMYTYTVTDSDPNNMADDTATLTFSITAEADIAPDFGTATIADQAFDIDETVALTLPVVETPGNGATRYFLYNRTGQAYVEDGASVIGLTYNAAARTLTGTVTAGLRFFVWVARDSDASFQGDFDTLDFTITVETDAPDFGAVTIADQIFAPDRSVTLTLPAVETPGNGGTSYTLSNLSTLPAGLTFNAATRVLSGTPTAVTTATMYTYTARDSDDDTDTLSFSITVEADIVPDFGMATLGNQTYIVGETVALTLPAVETSGNGATRYLLYNSTDGAYVADGASVLGLTFDRTARTLTGTPPAVGTISLIMDCDRLGHHLSG